MKIEWLDVDGLSGVVRNVNKENANVVRILYDDDNTLAEIELDSNHEIPWYDLISALEEFSELPFPELDWAEPPKGY